MTKLKVGSPAELISAVPFLIGFHPADSLTVVATHGSHVAFAARIDLPELGTPEDEARAAVLHLATIVRQHRVEAVTIIGYGEESRVTPAVLRISDAFRKQGLTIVDELRVADDRFWSYLCEDRSCCPPEGRPCLPPDSVVAAEATFAGAVALPSREALAAQLTPVTGKAREGMTVATARAMLRLAGLAGRPLPVAEAASDKGHEPASSSRLDQPAERSADGEPGPWRFHDRETAGLMVAEKNAGHLGSAELRLGGVLWAQLGLAVPAAEEPVPVRDEPAHRPGEATSSPALLSDEETFFAAIRTAGRLAVRDAERCYSSGGRLSDDDAAWLGVLLLHAPVRDYAWIRTRTREWELRFWTDMVRRVEDRYVAAPAALLAFVAWRTGHGALASVAVELALDHDPDYFLGVLMQAALVTGLPPSALDGWPTVEGMPPTDAATEANSDDGTTSSRVPLPRRPDVPKAEPANRSDESQRGKRRHEIRRPTRRRV